MVKIKDPQGNLVEAEQVEFEAVKEDWNIYRLKDGKTMKVKVIVTEVYRLATKDQLTERSDYVFKTTNATSIQDSEG